MAIEKMLVVDDEPIIRRSMEEMLRGRRYSVTTAATLADAERLLERSRFDLLFLDVRLPDGDGLDLLDRLSSAQGGPLIVMMSGFGTGETSAHCLRKGAFDFVAKPFSLTQIEVLARKAAAQRQAVQVTRYLQSQLVGACELIGESSAISQVRDQVRRVAQTNATVLIHGEPGASPEQVAHAICRAGIRSSFPCITVDCTVSEGLETRLFGREGAAELADGGTLLLTEIGALSADLQRRVLRLLQSGELERIETGRVVRVDARLLATTSRDLSHAVAAGEFREDLFYRLNLFPIRLPALRERPKDVPALAAHFLRALSRKHGVPIPVLSAAALEALCAHSWPRNLSELHNALERAVIVTANVGRGEISAEALGLSHAVPSPGRMLSLPLPSASSSSFPGSSLSRLPLPLPMPSLSLSASDEESAGSFTTLAELEKAHIFRALERTGGNRTKAAALLGISIRTMRNKLHEYSSASAHHS